MPDQVVRVECYSGYKADERPLKLHLEARHRNCGDRRSLVFARCDLLSRACGGRRPLLLRHEEAQDVWSLVGYRADA